MAAGCTDLDRENEHTDTYPLLMDNSSLSTNQDHIVNITTGRVTPGGRVEREEVCYNSSSAALSSSNEQGEVAISVDSLPRSFSTPVASHMRTTPANESLGRSGSFGRNTDTIGYGIRSRTSPLNSGLWILIELIVTMSQIIASIIVLSLSRNEKPRAPLSVWVIGYAAGCLATLPLLYWRYSCRRLQQAEQDSIALSGGLPSSPPSSPGTSLSGRMPTAQDEAADGGISSVRGAENSHHGDLRMRVFMDRFKIALDCFFAVWFVVGNVWVFGGHSSSREAPNLYRLCIVFLTFSCIGYAMPFILCATICCCLPCIITLLGLREQQGQAKGASPEVIEALPTYKFKAKVGNGGKGVKDGNDSDSEFSGEGGFVAAGTEKERAVSAEDAVCCICLGKYKDGVELKELPCTHFFHVDCVDKWLKINASCPLCKHEINGLGNPPEQSLTNAGEQS